ncbi:MAG: ATP-binding cassette domain-containing protein [Hyphomicrobiaceae bacterium]|nr:ATP-binding cassette domain-containing protein [Hyphomicrobiaceae bacterium]
MDEPSSRAFLASPRAPTARGEGEGHAQGAQVGAAPHPRPLPARREREQDGVVFELRRACAGYDGRPVLIDIDLTVRAGEHVAVMGRSGAGKSTLLGLLYAQRPHDVALVPQASALVKPLSVFHNVYIGRLDRHSTAYNLRTLVWPAASEVAEVRGVLASVDLEVEIFKAAGALSGGQQQRTSVARALYNGRPTLVGDEPVSALDRIQGSEILALLKSRHETLVLALHDVHHALEHADRVVVLEQGRKIIDEPVGALTANDLLRHFGGEP